MKMKNLAAILLCLVGLNFAADAQVTVTDGKIEAEITSTTTRQELAEMREALLAHNLEMRYDRISWDENWNLTSIHVMVKGQETEVASYHTDSMIADGTIRIVFRQSAPASEALCVGLNCD